MSTTSSFHPHRLQNKQRKAPPKSSSHNEIRPPGRVGPTIIPLPIFFVPGPFDVICSRGKKSKNHDGNVFFQSIIEASTEKYAKTDGKLEKSLIVSEIIATIRKRSPNGGFVKQDNGTWFEVGDLVAREKTGQSLRDTLSDKYRSSASSKKRRREESNTKMIEDMDAFIQSSNKVSKRIRRLSDTLASQTPVVSDLQIVMQMTQANSAILNLLKEDNTNRHELGEMDSSSQLDSDTKPAAK